MSRDLRISRLGLTVAKFAVARSVHFLMRYSRKWGDISFIGGHEMERDGGKLSRTAYRETMEEVPGFRGAQRITLEPLTEEFCYGPIFSRSAQIDTGYELQFFLLKFFTSPSEIIAAFGPRTANLLVPLEELRSTSNKNVSELVRILEWAYPGGLEAIPFSWENEINPSNVTSDRGLSEQLHLHLQTRG